MSKWMDDKGVFQEGFEENFPDDQRDFVKGSKSVQDIVKAGLAARREFRDRVKLPTKEEEKRKFVQEHFQDLLDADAKAAQEKRETDAKAAAEQQAKDAAAEAEKQNADRQKTVKTLLGGEDGKDFETNMELARRAMRGDHMPQAVKDALAAAVEAESFDKVTDEQIKDVLGRDPMMSQLALVMGKLAQDGRTETGDGHNRKETERIPAYPHQPNFYANRPDDDPEKAFFIARGARYENNKYVGGFAATTQ